MTKGELNKATSDMIIEGINEIVNCGVHITANSFDVITTDYVKNIGIIILDGKLFEEVKKLISEHFNGKNMQEGT